MYFTICILHSGSARAKGLGLSTVFAPALPEFLCKVMRCIKK